MRRLQNWPGLNHGWEAKCSIPLLVLLVNDSEYCDRDRQQYNKNPAKNFCWWDLDGVCRCRRCRCRAVVDGSLDLSARATSFFI
jgi:hypothetical protein